MWPVLLDMTKEESMQNLRNLELEAYAHLVSALRAQGPLNPDKRKLLKDTSQVLNIPQDRHKAEIRRAVNDEKLNTIAYHVTGLTESLEDWAQEGRRSVPLIPRMAPQTAYAAIADEVAENANQTNKQMPHPASTERKRPPSQPSLQTVPECSSKPASFRVPEVPKIDESKKRKLPISPENSSLAQHLLGPPKMSRTQQIYRQRTKSAILKEQMKLKPSQSSTKLPFQIPTSSNGQKITLQNVPSPNQNEETIEQIQNEINTYTPKSEALSNSIENQISRAKMFTSTKPSTITTVKHITTTTMTPGPSEFQKTLKICPPKKPIVKTGTSLGQKLIVVSNAQSIQGGSILQKTLSIPLVKNISVKNFEKFKIVTSTPQMITANNHNSSFKHKVVTVKTNNATKKVIPLSLINKGGIKVLPIGGKIVAKTTTTNATTPLYIVNTVGPKMPMQNVETSTSPSQENGKSSVLGDILKASGVTTDDFDTQIEEFRIPTNHVVGEGETQEQAEEESEETEVSEKDDYILLHENEEIIEETEVKSDQFKDNQEHFSNTEDSDTVFLQVPNSDLTSVSDSNGN